MSSTAPKEETDVEKANGHIPRKRGLDWRTWIVERFGWSWFTCTQSTGGIAVTLSECPKTFDGLQTIGLIVFIFNLVLFVAFTGLLITRWVIKPATFKKCFTQAPECFFFGSFWLTTATIIICMQRFGVAHSGPWLIVAIRILFWIYTALMLLSATVQFVVVAKYVPIKSIEMSPAWFLLVFKAMLIGTVASAIAMDQPPAQRLPIIVAGISCQGFGWIGSMLILSLFISSLMEKGWPAPSMAPGLFMPVGSSGFTIVALIGNARALPQGYGYLATHPTAVETLQIMATWVGVFLWVFALWLFGLAFFVCLGSLYQKNDQDRIIMPMTFRTTWWAMIFPNVGFTLATIYLGQELESNAILWVSTAMVILLVLFWLMDLVLMGKAIVLSLANPESDIKLS